MKATSDMIDVYIHGLPNTAVPGTPNRLIIEPLEYDRTGGLHIAGDIQSLVYVVLAVGEEVKHPLAKPGNYCVPLLPALDAVDPRGKFHSVLEQDILAYYTPEQLKKPDLPPVDMNNLTAGEARRLGMQVPVDLKNSDPFKPQEDK